MTPKIYIMTVNDTISCLIVTFFRVLPVVMMALLIFFGRGDSAV